MVERERLKEKERDRLDLLDKIAALEREMISLQADLISTKSQYEDLRRQLALNIKQLEQQMQIEHKLRKDLNKNLNQDLDLKRARDQVNF